MDDAKAKLAKALRWSHETALAAEKQLDRIVEEAEDLGLDISDEADEAVNELVLALNAFMNAFQDCLDKLEESEAAGIVPEDDDGDEAHPIH